VKSIAGYNWRAEALHDKNPWLAFSSTELAFSRKEEPLASDTRKHWQAVSAGFFGPCRVGVDSGLNTTLSVG
jgi:hypothetical protein